MCSVFGVVLCWTDPAVHMYMFCVCVVTQLSEPLSYYNRHAGRIIEVCKCMCMCSKATKAQQSSCHRLRRTTMVVQAMLVACRAVSTPAGGGSLPMALLMTCRRGGEGRGKGEQGTLEGREEARREVGMRFWSRLSNVSIALLHLRGLWLARTHTPVTKW